MSQQILIVDDDRWFYELLERQLVAAKYDVASAENGVAAMKQIDSNPPDAIILDMFMPGPDGLVLLHELQSYSDLASIPVILCTNSVPDVPQNILRSYGIVRVLDKTTMKPDDVITAVRKALWQ